MQTKQDKSKTKNSKISPLCDSKINKEIDCFLAGLEKEVDMVANAKITKKKLQFTCSDF